MIATLVWQITQGAGVGFQADCPTCGAPIEFTVANSVVTVCKNCSSVCGRADGSLETFGKVSDLTDTKSPLKVGLMGESRGVPFQVTGRTQLKHAAGGIWDEWYVAFRGGKKWGWLAEARGRYFLTFRQKLPDSHAIPPLEQLNIEDEVMIPKEGVLKVVEIGLAEVVSGEGEMPYAMKPGETYLYADLEGPGGKFATLDGSSEVPQLYVGGEFPLKRLGISDDVADREQEARTAPSAQVSCPNCGGSLELHAPDETERVGCPYCGGLLDVNEGNLTFLKVLSKQVKPTIPLGSKGKLDGTEFTVIGFMQKSVRSDGRDYFWNEYLLYAPRKPFHWLIESQHHWTFSKPVSAGHVSVASRTANCEGRTFKLFERGSNKVCYVAGEFYWKVSEGDRVYASDFVSAPYMLSREETLESKKKDELPPVRTAGKQQKKKKAAAKEVNYTLGHYVPVSEIEEAFGLEKKLATPKSVGCNQPFQNRGVYSTWLLMLAAALFVCLVVYVVSPRKVVFTKTFPLAKSATEHIEFIDQPIELRGRRNVEFQASNDRGGRWGYASIDLINEKDMKTTVTVPIQQSQAGKNRSAKKYLSAIPAGKYNLRIAFKWQDMKLTSQNITVKIRQGVPRMRYALGLLLFISLYPIVVMFQHGAFEARRWSESGV